MTIWAVKLVPLSDKNNNGRWTFVESERMNFDWVFGDEFVVSFKETQPFYQHGGYPNPEFRGE